MKRIRISHDKAVNKSRKLATKAWLASMRKRAPDEIKLTCDGTKMLVRVSGALGTELIQAEPGAIEYVKQNHPELEIREATAEEITEWANDKMTQQRHSTPQQEDIWASRADPAPLLSTNHESRARRIIVGDSV